MKILIPYFQISGTDSYPDSTNVLQIIDTILYLGNTYYLCEYTGNKNLQVGATYEEYKAWLEAQPPVTGIRVITTAAMRNRFTSAERRVIKRHEDFEVLDNYEDLLLRQYIDLDDPSLRAALEYMIAPLDGVPVLLNQERVDELLVDGTEYEAYE